MSEQIPSTANSGPSEDRQHEGEAALVSGDVGPRLELWSHHDPVTLFAAVGPTKTGWAELEPTFRAVAARLSGGRDVRYDLLAFDVSGDVAWSAGVALCRQHGWRARSRRPSSG